MVQKSLIGSALKGLLLRLTLLVIILGIGLSLFSYTVHDFVVQTLGYINPAGFLDMASWADWDIAWFISSTLWAGIIFGTIGKKMDCIFIIGFFVLCSLDFLYTQNMTWLVYSGLVGAAVVGNAIGFILKLARQRFFKDSWVGR